MIGILLVKSFRLTSTFWKYSGVNLFECIKGFDVWGVVFIISAKVEVGFVGVVGLKDNEEDDLNDIDEETLFDSSGEPY